jgi:hypothetical protein
MYYKKDSGHVSSVVAALHPLGLGNSDDRSLFDVNGGSVDVDAAEQGCRNGS